MENFQQGMGGLLMTDTENRNKDWWDKANYVATWIAGIIVALIVALIGNWVTNSYNKKANKIAQVQTVTGLIEPLSEAGEKRKLALVAIWYLGDPRLTAKFAEIYADDVSISVLSAMAASSDSKAQKEAIAALKTLADIKDKGSNIKKEATKALQDLPDKLKTLYKLEGY